MEIDLQEDLKAINGQLDGLMNELNKVNNARTTLTQQIQNLNGVAMYLRGKLPPEEAQTIPEPPEQVADSDELDRSVEYPTKEGTWHKE